MANNPAISVIIPMYNVEKYIGPCLNSILYQTFQDFEVIVVDDKSSDKSVSVVESLVPNFNGRLTLIKMSKNSGCAGIPRNIGFNHSKGNYVYFMDSDDMLTNTALQELYSFTDNGNVDLIHAPQNFVPVIKMADGQMIDTDIIEKDQEFKVVRLVEYEKPTFEPNNVGDRIKRFSHGQFGGAPWRYFARRNLIIENHLQFIDTKRFEDSLFFFYCICCAKKIINIPNLFYIYRVRPSSLCHNLDNRAIDKKIDMMIKVFISLDEFMHKKKIFVEKPELKYWVFNSFIRKLNDIFTVDIGKLPPYELDKYMYKKFSEDPRAGIALASYSFNMMNYFSSAFA